MLSDLSFLHLPKHRKISSFAGKGRKNSLFGEDTVNLDFLEQVSGGEMGMADCVVHLFIVEHH